MKGFTRLIEKRGSFRNQIIGVFVLGFFFLVTTFIVYMAGLERDNLQGENTSAAFGVAQSLAVSSRPWLLANDVVGMQELIESIHDYPELRHAMLVSPQGRVLAHGDPDKVGLFLADPASLRLVQLTGSQQMLANNELMVDVAVPIQVGTRLVGWARVALGRDAINDAMRDTMVRGAIFTLASSMLAFLAALLIANRLKARVSSLIGVAEGVQAGDFSVRAIIPGHKDEVTRLADSFNRMLDALESNGRELRAASRYSRSLIDANLDPLMIISPDGKITDLNRASEQATGKSREELIGSNFCACFTEPEKAYELCEQALREETVTDFPLAIRHRNGAVTDVLYNATVYRNEAGEVVGVFTAARDITERKQAEARLAESEQRFRAFVENANDIIYSHRPDGVLVYVSPNITEMLGYSVDEVIGRNFFEFVHPDDFPVCHELIEQIFRGRQKHEGLEYRLRNKHGGWQWHVSNLAPLFDAEGRITVLLGISRDVTEHKQVESRFHHMAEFDALTDLPNRVLFSDRLSQAIHYARRNQRQLAVIFLDLDKFKPINDNYGHAMGDRVLKIVAQRMQECVRESDTVARIGGDEFTVLLNDVENGDVVLHVAEKIRQALNQPIVIDNIQMNISSSSGVALFPEHGSDEIELTRHADFAMYHAKASGRDNVQFFHEGMGTGPLPTAGSRQ